MSTWRNQNETLHLISFRTQASTHHNGYELCTRSESVVSRIMGGLLEAHDLSSLGLHLNQAVFQLWNTVYLKFERWKFLLVQGTRVDQSTSTSWCFLECHSPWSCNTTITTNFLVGVFSHDGLPRRNVVWYANCVVISYVMIEKFCVKTKLSLEELSKHHGTLLAWSSKTIPAR